MLRAREHMIQLWAWPWVYTDASAIATENASRSRYKVSIREESIVKLTKNASILYNLEKKSEYLAPWPSHVRNAGSHVTLNTYYTWYILYSILSSPPALWTLDKSNAQVTKYWYENCKFFGWGGMHASGPYANNPLSMYIFTQQCNLPPICSLRVRLMLNYECSLPNLLRAW